MIRILSGRHPLFILDTAHTSYVFGVNETGQLVHDYYGRRIRVYDKEALREKFEFAPGNTVIYDQDHPAYSLENLCVEMSGNGKGDIGETMIELVGEDGSRTCDFVFVSSEVHKGVVPMETLPSSREDEEAGEHLLILLKDRNSGATLEMHYHVFEECDVITRRTVLRNTGDKTLQVERLLSAQLGFYRTGLRTTFFRGAWAREMNRFDQVVENGKLVNASRAGTSSSRANPFFMISDPSATEDTGDCYGFNLVYSGNHYTAVEADSYGKTRVVTGINPEGFRWILKPEEQLETPEAVMTFSHEGFNGMSHHMHAFVTNHIVRKEWAKKERPVLLNSWEASYFNFNLFTVLRLARAAREVGVELFVLDDGWFGKRNDDHAGLGDWDVNTRKLPGGLKALGQRLNDMGLEFGIWVEPEMVNVDSNLYRAHPDWTIEIPGKPHSEGRNQRILDLCNPVVVDYLINKMSKVFSSANITYVKWDMNRIFSDVYAPSLPAEQQGECSHRYVMGLYRMMSSLTERFPKILFEGCCSGGNRFDLGILSYFPQIWASDNTDAISRVDIQNGYSYGYPLSTIGAHVSSTPNHQTLRTTPLETRFHVAMFGVLGYECNLNDMSSEDRSAVSEQIALYKQYRKLLQFGDFYRQEDVEEHRTWTVVSKDRTSAVGMCVQKLVKANSGYLDYFARGLAPEKLYHFYGEDLKHNIMAFGDLINTVAPFHVRQNSLTHYTISRFVKMNGEQEDLKAYGDELMYAGVKLHPGYAGTGYNDDVRFYPDFASRIYFMEETVEDEETVSDD